MLSNHNWLMSTTRYLACISLIFTSLLLSCSDDEPTPFNGPVLPIDQSNLISPSSPTMIRHWAKESRGIPIDEEDFIVIPRLRDQIEENFNHLVINRQLITAQTGEECFEEGNASALLPAEQVQSLLSEIDDLVSLPSLIVNIDLLTPKRTNVYRLCLSGSGNNNPLYSIDDHREHIIAAFKDIARIDRVKYITVGIQMNEYYHMTDRQGVPFQWDYQNWMSLYREIYTAVKEINANIKVGPSVGWSTFISKTINEISEEFALDLGVEEERLMAIEISAARTIWPMLTDRTGEKRFADYLGVAILPQINDAPFNGNPSLEADNSAEIRAYYRDMPLLATPVTQKGTLEIPIAFTQIDWQSPNQANAGNKGPFLETLKETIAHIDPLWISWRRLADIPTDPPESSRCRVFTGEVRGYPEHFCFSGMITASGNKRDLLWDVFTTNP